MKADWVVVVFDGSAAAFSSFVAAVAVVKWQSGSDRKLAKQERRLTMAGTLLGMLAELESILVSGGLKGDEGRVEAQIEVVRKLGLPS
jgi:hypothetical protein